MLASSRIYPLIVEDADRIVRQLFVLHPVVKKRDKKANLPNQETTSWICPEII